MRFARIGQPGNEMPVVIIEEDFFVDIADRTDDINGNFLSRFDLPELTAEVERRVASGEVQQ